MTETHRPDLSGASPDVIAYIEALEAALAAQREHGLRVGTAAEEVVDEAPLEPNEPPTTLNVISVSAGGLAKRTPRHLYARQRRGGMGIFDLEPPDRDAPAFLVVADEAHDLILLTNLARAFRVEGSRVATRPVRARGVPILPEGALQPDERLAAVAPPGRGAPIALGREEGLARG